MDGEFIEGPEAIRGLVDAWFAAYEDIEADLAGFNDLGNGVPLNARVADERGQALSEENVEVVLRAFIATSGGDPTMVEYDPLAEWDMNGVTGWPEKDVYRGSEIPQFLQAWANSWRDWHFDIEEVLDADQQVFVAIREWGIGVESDAGVDQRRYFAVTVENGRIMRVRMFSDRTDALRTVGLME